MTKFALVYVKKHVVEISSVQGEDNRYAVEHRTDGWIDKVLDLLDLWEITETQVVYKK